MKETYNKGACTYRKTDYLDKKAKNIKKFQKTIAFVKKM